MPSHRHERLVERLINLNALLAETLERKPSRALPALVSVFKGRIEKVKKQLKIAKPLPKGELAVELAEDCGITKAMALDFLDSLAVLGTAEMKKTGLFVVPGLARLNVKTLPQRVAGKKGLFGKEVMMKAYPSRRVMKAFPVAALKRSLN